jgi:general secretion pathway protein F
MRYELKALRSPNEIVSLPLEAADEQDAVAQAKAQGYVVLSARPLRSWLSAGRYRRRTAFPLLLFTQELFVLLSAGLPLAEALDALSEKERRGSVKNIIAQISSDLREGQTLSTALQRHPTVFPPIYIATVRASETTGNLGEALSRYVSYQAKLDAVREKVASASIYPLLLVGVGSLVVLFLMFYVVPSFTRIYEDVGTNLPIASRWLLEWGKLLEKHGVWVISIMAVILISVLYAFTTPASRRWLNAKIWRLPGIGERIRTYHLARFYRMVGMLLRGGTPIVRALNMAAGLLHPALREPLTEATRRISEGRSISESLDQVGLTTPVALRMLGIGERSGAMGDMMERIAIFHDEEVARWVDRFMRLFEPILMTLIGLVIGGIVVLMYLPIFELAGSIQ